jgi:uncharacterized membrane protein
MLTAFIACATVVYVLSSIFWLVLWFLDDRRQREQREKDAWHSEFQTDSEKAGS